jgi:hypothetical protein
MKKFGTLLRTVFPAVILIAGFGYLVATAQTTNPSSTASAQDQMQQPDQQKPAADAKTFSGKIVKTGNVLVLSDQTGKKTYQLDDQQKAQGFLNQDVKVTGVLDPATGTIRVTSIDPV